MSTNDLAIHVEDLGKQYQIGSPVRYQTLRDSVSNWFSRKSNGEKNTIWAVRNLSFSIRQGEVMGIVGRNGAGKSTLLKLLARITRPTEGRAIVRGRMGSLLEVGTGFHTELNGRENVYLNGALLGMTRAEIYRKFDQIVDFAGVEAFLDTPVKHYSTGMFMRLAFAVAAHLEPEILVIDEVLAVGDAAFQRRCLGKIDDVARSGRTVLFVSHNMGAVSRLCSTGICLDRGQIVYSGQTRDVIEHYHALNRNPDTAEDGERRFGGGEVRFHDVASEQTSYRPEEEKVIRFRLRRLDPRVRFICLSCLVKDEKGTVLAQCDSRLVGPEVDLEQVTAGRFVLRGPWLKPGDYWVDLVAGISSVGVLDRFERACRLTVVPSLPYPGAAPPECIAYGAVLADFEWELDRS
jgi:lipopolysaccharide transport system ATP-binding protein